MNVEQILLYIKDLPIKEVLAYLFANKIYDLSKKGYGSIRRIVQDKIAEKRFGFTPKKDEYNFLIRVAAEKAYFQEFGNILPKHRYSDLIRVGYLISHLNKLGGEENRVRVLVVRNSIFQRPNKITLIKIVNLVTTGAIVPVVDYLSELKKKNYDSEYLTNIFDEIILEWKKYAYFVKSEYKETEIIENIKQRIQINQKLIMVFSYSSAKYNTTKAVAQLLKENISKNYFYESKNNIEGDKEVHTSTFTLME